MVQSYREAEACLLDIPKFASKNEPGVTREFLETFGDLSETVPTIHVAGTNGKGSVCAYLRAGLNNAGYSVGLFTSPHLVCMRERFNIDGEDISEEEFVDSFMEVRRHLEDFVKKPGREKYHPTFFEYLFFMAMVWFGKKKPDVLVLETGLGGRLDATNSIAAPRVCVITEIGFDHMEYLGDTKELIAGEKAGIIKKGAGVVFNDAGDGASEVIRRKAEELGRSAMAVGPGNIKNLETTPRGIDFWVQYGYDNCAHFSLPVRALYQAGNAALAYGALMQLNSFPDFSADPELMRKGFENMIWPGRMEEVEPGLFLDGAHNEDGIRAFLASVRAIDPGKNRLLFSMVSDKQVELVGGLAADSGLFDTIYICKLDSPRFAGMQRLKSVFDKYPEIAIKRFDTAASALAAMKDEACGHNMFVVGSLYLVGEVKALLEK
jgi:dihydrofolate synthase/folylpolyglutamate synthase